MNWETHFHRGISWPELEAKQGQCLKAIHQNSQKGFLLVSEPEPTLTYGRSSDPKDRLWSEEILKRKGIGVYPVSRGGKWTYHGPGQIVVYPLVRLTSLGYHTKAVRQFLHDLKASVCQFLYDLTLSPQTPEDKPFGIYTKDGKLASFGIAIHQGICMHGLALYLKPQMESFSSINPCGVPGEKIISLQELHKELTWDKAANQLTNQIKKGFQ